MRSFTIYFISIFVFPTWAKNCTTYNLGREVCGKKIIFEDDFSSKDIYAKWRHVVKFSSYPDYEFNYYDRTRENLYLKDGMLHIKPTLLADREKPEFVLKGNLDLTEYPPKPSRCTLKPDSGLCHKKASGFQILPPVISARVSSKFRFRYGSVEIRAKLPQGDWIYPQIELSPPSGNSRYGQFAGSVVIALVRGNEDLSFPGYDPRLNFGQSWLEAGVFAGTYEPKTTPTIVASFNQSGWSNSFHIFRVDWFPGTLSFSVDGIPIGTGSIATKRLLPAPLSANAPIDEEMEIAFGIGVGGIQRFPDGITSAGISKPWKNTSPKALLNFWRAKNLWYPSWKGKDTELLVDSVKVWSLEGESGVPDLATREILLKDGGKG